MVFDNQLTRNAEPQKVVIKTSMDITNGQLFQLEQESLLVLQSIANRFESSRTYKEKEVNVILEAVYDDYVTLRRFLIEHGLLGRTRDGSQYWLEQGLKKGGKVQLLDFEPK